MSFVPAYQPTDIWRERYELPAFSTLDRLTGRVRTLVYGCIYRMVQRRMTAEIQHGLEALFEVQLPSHRSAQGNLSGSNYAGFTGSGQVFLAGTASSGQSTSVTVQVVLKAQVSFATPDGTYTDAPLVTFTPTLCQARV